ncbi:GNAT family N-acetyltransferase [Actinoplanes sp. NPDC051861]|uniref:GNAT family N-acetyltransferase n=1 Tax=Actinoplanes sp. NPDC051861 TaxID=3155170 RepID=UPI00343127E3
MIRPATDADAPALAALHVRTWQAAYRGLMPQEYLDGLDPAQRVPGWREWIRDLRPPAGIWVLDDGGLAGFLTMSGHDDVGEIHAIYLAPERWGQGLGRELMAFALDHLTAAGFTEAVLWTLDTNERARRFYEAGGWTVDGGARVDETRGAAMTEIRYRRPLAPPEHLAAPGDDSAESQGEQTDLAG